MPEADEEPIERPATWENVVTGVVKEVFGRVTGDADLVEEGEEQTEVAQEVHEEYKEEHHHDET